MNFNPEIWTIKCLVGFDQIVQIIDKVPLPELHVLLGVMNHLFCDKGGLIDLVRVMPWPIQCKVVSVGYHGEVFSGPAYWKLLRSSDFLKSAKFLQDLENPLANVPLSSTFLAFDKLVNTCFGANNLQEDLNKLLDNFNWSFEALDCSVTLQVHIVLSIIFLD